MAAETPEERERRLQRMRTNQQERLAVETPEERETRLQHMRDRLAAETTEARETCTPHIIILDVRTYANVLFIHTYDHFETD